MINFYKEINLKKMNFINNKMRLIFKSVLYKRYDFKNFDK